MDYLEKLFTVCNTNVNCNCEFRTSDGCYFAVKKFPSDWNMNLVKSVVDKAMAKRLLESSSLDNSVTD